MTDLTPEQIAELDNLVSAFDDKASARELPTSKLAQLLAERTAEAEERCGRFADALADVHNHINSHLSHDEPHETATCVLTRIADLERRLAEAKALINEMLPAAEIGISAGLRPLEASFARENTGWRPRIAALDAPTVGEENCNAQKG